MIDDPPHHSQRPPPRPHQVGAVSRRAAALAVALVVVLAGCGDDGGRPGAGAEDPAVEASSTGGGGTTPPGEGDGPRGGGGGAAGECPEPADDLAPFASVALATAVDGTDHEWCLLLADDVGSRQQGLMGVTDLGPFDGMLFAYAGTSSGGYWMRDTPMPLSIAWISPEGEVVATADMDPCLEAGATCPIHGPGGASYRWAIEVPQGGLGALGLEVGVALDVAGWPLGTD